MSNVSLSSSFLLDDYGDDEVDAKRVAAVQKGGSEHHEYVDEYESSVMKMFAAGVEGDANGSWTTKDGLELGGSSDAWNQATSEGKLQCHEYNWPVLFLFTIVILAIGGNVLVCAAVRRERKLRSMFNYFLVSLALSDMLSATLVMPLSIVRSLIDCLPIPKLLCFAWYSLDVFFTSSTICHLCMISIDRYLALSFPLRYCHAKNSRFMATKIAIVWVVSFCIAGPLFILSMLDEQESVQHYKGCGPETQAFVISATVSSFYVPLAIMTVMYALTVHALRRQLREQRRMIVDHQYQQPTAKTRLANTAATTSGVGRGGNALLSTPQLASTVRSTTIAAQSRDAVAHHRFSAGSAVWSITDASPSEHVTPLITSSSSTNGGRISRRSEQQWPVDGSSPVVGSVSVHVAETRFSSSSPGCCSATVTSDISPSTILDADQSIDLVGSHNGRNSSALHLQTAVGVDVATTEARTSRRSGGFTAAGSLGAPSPRRPASLMMAPTSTSSALSGPDRGRRAVRVLGILFAVFVVFYLPFFAVYIVNRTCDTCRPYITSSIVTAFEWLQYSGSMLNPIVYHIFNPDFRRAFHKILRCR